jgi:hypothetical protein
VGLAPAPITVVYGSVTGTQTLAGTLTGGAVFDDGSTSQNKSTAGATGSAIFRIKAKPGSAPGTAFTLQVKMGALTITKTGKAARERWLPMLLR